MRGQGNTITETPRAAATPARVQAAGGTPPSPAAAPVRRVVVGHSGGVTSAWALGWALRTFPRDEVVALWHDTKAEDEDTLRFLREIAAKLGIEITERSDGRSVEQVEDDEGALANNRMAFCTRILKLKQRERYFAELRAAGVTTIVNVLGFTGLERERIQNAAGRAIGGGYDARSPLAEEKITKQQAADWCVSLGVRPPRMYEWSDHANCPGCRRGGRAYFLALDENMPHVFAHLVQREAEFGHTIINGTTLADLKTNGLKRNVKRRESITIGSCECGS